MAHKHAHKWGRRGENEPTLPAYRRTTSPSPPSAPRGPRCARLQHLRVRERGTWGRKGPCDTTVRHAACMPCDTSGARMPAAVPEFPARILLQQRPLRPTTSLASKARATVVRTSGAVSFRVTSGKDELLATGLPLFMVCVLPFRSARGTVSVREGGSGGAGDVEPASLSWNDMASTASTSIVRSVSTRVDRRGCCRNSEGRFGKG